jgi:hypothetical protein
MSRQTGLPEPPEPPAEVVWVGDGAGLGLV